MIWMVHVGVIEKVSLPVAAVSHIALVLSENFFSYVKNISSLNSL